MQRNPVDTFAGSIDLLDRLSANFRWIFDMAFTVLALRLEVRDFWQGALDILITKRADSSIKSCLPRAVGYPKTILARTAARELGQHKGNSPFQWLSRITRFS